jgi:hypothetical protein
MLLRISVPLDRFDSATTTPRPTLTTVANTQPLPLADLPQGNPTFYRS